METIVGGDTDYLCNIIFMVEVINGKSKRNEVFNTEQYHEIVTIKNWIIKRENLGPCTIHIFNSENVELIEGSLAANNVKLGDVLKAIVTMEQ